MISIKGVLVGLLTGILLTVSWIIFIDGQIHSHDRFPPMHILPPLFALFSVVLMNFVNPNDIEENNKVRVWLFFWVTIQTVCIGSSIYILSTQYSVEDNWAGVSLMLNTVFTMFAGFLFFVGRKD